MTRRVDSHVSLPGAKVFPIARIRLLSPMPENKSFHCQAAFSTTSEIKYYYQVVSLAAAAGERYLHSSFGSGSLSGSPGRSTAGLPAAPVPREAAGALSGQLQQLFPAGLSSAALCPLSSAARAGR